MRKSLSAEKGFLQSLRHALRATSLYTKEAGAAELRNAIRAQFVTPRRLMPANAGGKIEL